MMMVSEKNFQILLAFCTRIHDRHSKNYIFLLKISLEMFLKISNILGNGRFVKNYYDGKKSRIYFERLFY